MRYIANLERMLERALERPAARLFRTRLQPIQVQRRIERAMEERKQAEGKRIHAPDAFHIRLARTDFEDLRSGHDINVVASDLADAALVFARRRGYTLDGRPRIELSPESGLRVGEIDVETLFSSDARDSGAGSLEHTTAFEVPAVHGPIAVLREVRRDGTERSVRVDGRLLTIGRGDDNGLVLPDPRVSRHHAQVRARHGMLVLTDLDSRNGVRVNGARVAEAALGPGDRIELGDTVLVVDAVAPD